MKKKRLVIHIGVHRTGSTAVQNAFAGNAGLLARHGILYPKYPGGPAHAVNHNRLAWGILHGTVNLARLRKWAETLAKTNAHTVIFSAEDFCRLKNLEFLACFRELFEVEIVVYVRRQDAWVGSWYNQHIKWPHASELAQCTPNEFLGHLQEFFWINYFDTVERWARAVGRDQIRIRVLERGQIVDPVADLCDICGVDFILEKLPEKRTNESLPAAQLKILRDIGIIRYASEVRINIIEAVRGIPAASSADIYPVPIRRMILKRYAAGNAMLAERYLGRKDRILFREDDFSDGPSGNEVPVDDETLLSLARNLIDGFRTSAVRVRPKSKSPQRPPPSTPQSQAG